MSITAENVEALTAIAYERAEWPTKNLLLLNSVGVLNPEETQAAITRTLAESAVTVAQAVAVVQGEEFDDDAQDFVAFTEALLDNAGPIVNAWVKEHQGQMEAMRAILEKRANNAFSRPQGQAGLQVPQEKRLILPGDPK